MRGLAMVLVMAGCAATDEDHVVGPFTGTTHRYTLDEIQLPRTSSQAADFGADLDGNGTNDNMLGWAISLLGYWGNVTEHGNDMIAGGAIATSLEIVADDLENDPTVGVRYLGTPDSPFVILGGRIEEGRFRSNRTAHTSVAGQATLHLPVFMEADPSLVAAIGVEMILEPDGAGGFEATVHGAIPTDMAFKAALHDGFTQMVASDPASHRVMMNLFDDRPRDGMLSYEEIATNSLLVSWLSPDLVIAGVPAISVGFRAHFRPCPEGGCTDDLPLDRCFDRRLDGDETDVDCGGSCRSCEAGATCIAASDCETIVCDVGTCGPPSCTNGARDGLESDVDCGGGCPGCALGQRCYFPSDCATQQCGSPDASSSDLSAQLCEPYQP